MALSDELSKLKVLHDRGALRSTVPGRRLQRLNRLPATMPVA